MINLLLGRPGSGKSFEAVAYHLVPALKEGRMVITNLSLNLEALEMAGFDTSLILKYETFEKGKRPFSTIDFFKNPWRHPVTGSGPLYIIDECHFVHPNGATPRPVEEWYSMHRHESADVLLITQSYGKVSRAIIDLVQICYRVSKNTALGSDSSYVRKVYDGVRGEQVNQNVRTYDLSKIGFYDKTAKHFSFGPFKIEWESKGKFFPFYVSNTQGGGKELAASDVRPIWKHWSFYGAAACILLLVYLVGYKGVSFNLLENKVTRDHKAQLSSANSAVPKLPAPLPSHSLPKPPPPSNLAVPAPSNPSLSNSPFPSLAPAPIRHPYAPFGLHLSGHMLGKKDGKDWAQYVISISQNGLQISTITDKEFIKAGYSFELINHCLAKSSYKGGPEFFLFCDVGRASAGMMGGNQSQNPNAVDSSNGNASKVLPLKDSAIQGEKLDDKEASNIPPPVGKDYVPPGSDYVPPGSKPNGSQMPAKSDFPLPQGSAGGVASAARRGPATQPLEGQNKPVSSCFGTLCADSQK